MLEIILLAVTLLYAVFLFTCAIVLVVVRYSTRGATPFVSVVIAARNEERNIARCLESIAALDYPADRFEVIVVDDHSQDRTAEIVQRHAESMGNIRLVEAGDPVAHLLGKMNAVAQGIKHCRGEIIALTDADCVVPPRWLRNTVRYFADDSIGLVAGFVNLEGANLFHKIQGLDWYFLFGVAAGTIRLGFPITAVGNNLSVRREAYDEVGGYENIPFSVTEDFALVQAITSRTKFRARFAADRETLVQTPACANWRELFHQKRRWFAGGRDAGWTKLLLFLLAYIAVVFPPFVAALSLGPIPLAALFTKLVAEGVFLLTVLIQMGRMGDFRFFMAFQGYFILYVAIFPLLTLARNGVRWKERTYEG
jgi:cellulose synthase/poly-beta-1,6-N-acetylglucosamine synthase-like glycosyltransferase